MYIFTFDVSFQLEIYDGPVEESKYNLNEEEISQLEEKVSVARKYVWGWTSSVKVSRARNVTCTDVTSRPLFFSMTGGVVGGGERVLGNF